MPAATAGRDHQHIVERLGRCREGCNAHRRSGSACPSRGPRADPTAIAHVDVELAVGERIAPQRGLSEPRLATRAAEKPAITTAPPHRLNREPNTRDCDLREVARAQVEHPVERVATDERLNAVAQNGANAELGRRKTLHRWTYHGWLDGASVGTATCESSAQGQGSHKPSRACSGSDHPRSSRADIFVTPMRPL